MRKGPKVCSSQGRAKSCSVEGPSKLPEFSADPSSEISNKKRFLKGKSVSCVAHRQWQWDKTGD